MGGMGSDTDNYVLFFPPHSRRPRTGLQFFAQKNRGLFFNSLHRQPVQHDSQ